MIFLARTRPLDAQGQGAADEFYDSHFHLTNYIQQGIEPSDFLKIMGTRVRSIDAVRHSVAAAVVVRELG